MSAHAVGTMTVYVVRIFKLLPMSTDFHLASCAKFDDLDSAVDYYNKKLSQDSTLRAAIIGETEVILEEDT